MRIVCGILCVLMLLFAVVQYNDPDWFYWGAIYVITAIWCGLAAFRQEMFVNKAAVAGLTVFLLASLAGVYWYWPQTPGWWTQDVWWKTETAREGMGMMIVAACLAAAWVVARKVASRA